MIIKNLYVNNIIVEMDELEITCIKKGIPYLRLENEFHFLNYIYFFKNKMLNIEKDFLKQEKKSNLQQKKEKLKSIITNQIQLQRIRKRDKIDKSSN